MTRTWRQVSYTPATACGVLFIERFVTIKQLVRSSMPQLCEPLSAIPENTSTALSVVVLCLKLMRNLLSHGCDPDTLADDEGAVRFVSSVVDSIPKALSALASHAQGSAGVQFFGDFTKHSYKILLKARVFCFVLFCFSILYFVILQMCLF